MRWTIGWALAMGASTALLASTASAQAPAFDCAKAKGDVEKLICKDAGLAALDRKLNGVFKAATAKARDAMPARLRSEQRGWVKGRNDCWKANGVPTYLTASWQVSTVHDCVEGKYKLRISDLQAQWHLAPARGAVSYMCANNPANEVVATFFETDPPTARLERGDRVATTWQVGAGSEAKYEGQNIEILIKGDEVGVTWADEQIQCRKR